MKFGIITADSGVISIPIVLRGRTVDHYEIVPSAASLTKEQWISHLRDKRWFTPDIEADFCNAFASLAD